MAKEKKLGTDEAPPQVLNLVLQESGEPEAEDFASIAREYGQLPKDCSDEDAAHHYRLAQIMKLLRISGLDGR